ncbi:bifunctional DNA-formamidopyrimidine glycosylase/DNA-(apurinic or apyrimidinic site) lyase [Salidesulfovibrio onnuriiensis]|uniref:bifunctional DNA-formamidopyrimidine glycosylase/DNA-(apurinic or apyrimidinic site) lyase n=1 Tax=Salidesulfovibrio onnuriiensis TaxID=2583823 RepID=UPI0011C91811|nr:bifunctional DNA-formamidopyrimidine glycosylase/DNA-(apurinic or apyrimidinic site) lyase [Salidesulfovibrio onnuriiensis]
MPELPEVETIARGLHRSLQGRRIESVDVYWEGSVHNEQPEFLARVQGRAVVRTHRRAKLLLMDLEGGIRLAFHLKMTGRVVHEAERERQPHDRVRFTLDNGSVLTFADVRKFGYVRAFADREIEEWKFWRTLGPEPLEASAESLAESVRGRAARIKALLLDQSVVAGVGNIYADESLFRARLRPDCKACCIPYDRLVELFNHLKEVLEQAIAENGSSIRDYVNADGDAGAFQNSFNVYGKKGESCPRCGCGLTARKVAGRTSTFCPGCQEDAF